MAGAADQCDEVLDLYFQDIAYSKPLSAEEEVTLARQIRAGSREARDRLVVANLRFVIRIACEYRDNGVALEDLISAGNLGLITAAERFDETRGCKFITYASWWVRQAIRHTLSHDARMVRLPTNRLRLLRRISALSRKWRQKRETDPGPEALADALGVSAELVYDTLAQSQTTCSLDAHAWEDADNSPLRLLLPDDAQQAPDTRISEESDRQQIETMLDSLSEREAEVLRSHFGLGGQDAETLEDIGDRLGLSKERVRQIEEKALNKLRHPRRRAQLEPLRVSL